MAGDGRFGLSATWPRPERRRAARCLVGSDPSSVQFDRFEYPGCDSSDDVTVERTLSASYRRLRDGVIHETIFRLGAESHAKGVELLCEAANEGRCTVVKMLIDSGVDGNASTVDGITPAAMGAAAGHTEVIEVLVAHGVNLDRPAPHG